MANSNSCNLSCTIIWSRQDFCLMGDVAKGIKSFKKGMATDITEEPEPKNISENNQDTKDKE